MRLFVAIELPDGARAAIAAAIAELQPRAGGARLGWTQADRAHLTLHFLGEVDQARTARLLPLLAAPCAEPPFDLALGGLGVFPSRRAARVLWTGVTAGAEPVHRLHREVGIRLHGAGVTVDPRPYTPHLTLARMRAPLPPATLRAILESPPGEIARWRVERATLFESRPGTGGHIYTALAFAPLSGMAPSGED